ncbi:hypothetical protein [Bacteroides sp. An322]|jgi:hypothetical protein|uniref:hypothetical protein n=1 Tax=Bacteroides sp. An322 TaxID=1965632 RepID=UPI000B386C6C|nr:hypothetical protein [Bacteroides sp. An322]OUO23735.1 hypothetical protein B5F91_02515 [Bacteroides sp. An322]
MEKHFITEDELLKRGYKKSADGTKYRKRLGNKDFDFIPNGRGLLPKSELDDPQKTRHFEQIDTLEELENFEKFAREGFKQKPEA